MKRLHIHEPWGFALTIIIALIFIFLGVVCIHWGITVHDTVSGLSVAIGGFLIFFAIKMGYLACRRSIIYGRIEP